VLTRASVESVSVAFIGDTLLGGEGYHTCGRHHRVLRTLNHEYPGLVRKNATRHRTGVKQDLGCELPRTPLLKLSKKSGRPQNEGLRSPRNGAKGLYRYGMRAIPALETPLSDFLDSFLLGRWVNKGKREGRGHSTMALQVLPVRGGVRFYRCAK